MTCVTSASKPQAELDLEVKIAAAGVELAGNVLLPVRAKGLVLFAHGSGSSRHSGRNVFVAQVLHKAGMGTLLFDLLSAEEEQIDRYTREYRFNIQLLADRLEDATRWVDAHARLSLLPVGYFGASTGSAAALIAGARLAEHIGAIVSRGGRPDLAEPVLHDVGAPTLLIVGGNDDIVIDLNQQAYEQLRCEKAMKVVAGATHLFEEPGTLAAAADMAAAWFSEHLSSLNTKNRGAASDHAVRRS